MEFDQLRLFADLVREQSFTRVAERNLITQPAVSLSIQKLEDELGVRLLERTTRKVLVTEEGRILYGYARDILDKVDEARAVLMERQQRVLGEIRIATVHSVGLYELPAALREFIRRYPEVQLHIDYRSSDAVYHAVMEGHADLGLVAYPEQRRNVVVVPLFSDELVVICDPTHALAGREAVGLEELAGTPFVAFQPEIPTRRAIDAVLAERGIAVDIRMQCDNIEVLKKMVEVGLGISLVPQYAAHQEARTGTLRSIPVRGASILRPVALIHRKTKTITRPQRVFIDLLAVEGAALRDSEASAAPERTVLR